MMKLILSLFGLILPFYAKAAPLSIIDICNPSLGCYIQSVLGATANATFYTANDQYGLSVYTEYNLGASSNHYDPGTEYGYPPVRTSLSGSVFLRSQFQYLASDSSFRVSLIDSGPSWQGTPFRTTNFDLSFEALLAGYGYEYNSGGAGEIDPEEGVYYGNMQSDKWLHSCIECGWDIDIQLIDMLYSFNGSYFQFNVNPFDDRELLYKDQTTYYYNDITTYSLSDVPVPAAAWLFGSALVGLAGIKRKK
ncbi:VPLPA-CTERM sorting domain-containing protein [Oceanicoccus sp. KOV_DT_Chl]|uniref:VPLPA-CTERM sorting domain-containing protein n=1 Tax=Oceanicoccus sp. KOV_DT_Chl TaxID=1904639 RepID=UPI000C797B4F|nr:VPLPA-CTERM sorting domain-containing protein [Oceanicoccus sp. KOV_DT_Chl]